MMQAAATIAGVGESVHDMRIAPFFVLGCGAGTFAAIVWKRR
jgi:hypothetical protein